jgi:hypothetical protein
VLFKPGTVTIVWSMIANSGFSRLTMFRRLYEKYGDAGLRFVLVDKTYGFTWRSPPQAPNDEANVKAWQYLEELGLPMTLIIDSTTYSVDHIGRRISHPIPFEREWQLPGGPKGIVGRDGKFRSVTIGTGDSEPMAEAFVRQALGLDKPVESKK